MLGILSTPVLLALPGATAGTPASNAPYPGPSLKDGITHSGSGWNSSVYHTANLTSGNITAWLAATGYGGPTALTVTLGFVSPSFTVTTATSWTVWFNWTVSWSASTNCTTGEAASATGRLMGAIDQKTPTGWTFLKQTRVGLGSVKFDPGCFGTIQSKNPRVKAIHKAVSVSFAAGNTYRFDSYLVASVYSNGFYSFAGLAFGPGGGGASLHSIQAV